MANYFIDPSVHAQLMVIKTKVNHLRPEKRKKLIEAIKIEYYPSKIKIQFKLTKNQLNEFTVVYYNKTSVIPDIAVGFPIKYHRGKHWVSILVLPKIIGFPISAFIK